MLSDAGAACGELGGECKGVKLVEPREEFAMLMKGLREGSEDAAKELLEKYGPHIFRVVRRRLSRKLRTKYDSSDFVQSVWASFFAVPSTAEDFDSPEALIAYLVKVARNKVVDAVRQRYGKTKYNVNRERSLEGSAAFQAQGIANRQPRPSQIVVAREEWDRLVAKLPTHQKIIVELLRRGYTHREIADKIGVDEKTIRRLVRRIAPEFLPDEESRQASPV